VKFQQCHQIIWKLNRTAVMLGLALVQQASSLGSTLAIFSAGMMGW